MVSFVRNYLQSEKARREENDEKGFSLIELIIVVVILGILAAIAIPIFLNIQNQANENALRSIAANGASQAAAAFAQDKTYIASGADASASTDDFDLTNLNDTAANVTVTLISGSSDDIDAVCVGASRNGSTTEGVDYQTAGPGC